MPNPRALTAATLAACALAGCSTTDWEGDVDTVVSALEVNAESTMEYTPDTGGLLSSDLDGQWGTITSSMSVDEAVDVLTGATADVGWDTPECSPITAEEASDVLARQGMGDGQLCDVSLGGETYGSVVISSNAGGVLIDYGFGPDAKPRA